MAELRLERGELVAQILGDRGLGRSGVGHGLLLGFGLRDGASLGGDLLARFIDGGGQLAGHRLKCRLVGLDLLERRFSRGDCGGGGIGRRLLGRSGRVGIGLGLGHGIDFGLGDRHRIGRGFGGSGGNFDLLGGGGRGVLRVCRCCVARQPGHSAAFVAASVFCAATTASCARSASA